MKVVFAVLSVILMALSNVVGAEPLSCDISAESALLINADTGAILFEKNARTVRYPASTTKIAVAAYVLHAYADRLDDIVEAEQEALGTVKEEAKRRVNYKMPSYRLVTDASHMGIKKGEKMRLRDLLFGTMVASADDASNVIAMYLGGTIPDFMDELNAYLKSIGCQNTHFNNPHGLHHPDHKTTAYDLAIMTREAMKHPLFREMVSTVRYPRPKTNKQESTTLLQTNRLLRKGKHYYAKAIGVKTGHTSAAGSNLVAAAKDGDRTLISVVMKAKDNNERFADTIALFNAAFNQPRMRKILLKGGLQKFQVDLPGAADTVHTWIADDVVLEYYPAEQPQIKTYLNWVAAKPPIGKGQTVGELQIQNSDGILLQSIPLLAAEDVNGSWWWSLKQGTSTWKWVGVCVLLASLIALLFQLKRNA